MLTSSKSSACDAVPLTNAAFIAEVRSVRDKRRDRAGAVRQQVLAQDPDSWFCRTWNR